MEIDQELTARPAGYADQLRQFVNALPWKAERDDPRRIAWLDLAMMALFVVIFWHLI